MEKKNKICKIFLVSLLAFIITNNFVYGLTVKSGDYLYYNNETNDGGYRIKRLVNGEEDYVLFLNSEQGRVFCIEPGLNVGSTDSYSEGLETYINSKINNSTKAKEVTKKINEYLYFGFNENDSSKNTMNYYAATQKLIWETLYSNGFPINYSSEAYFTLNNISKVANLDTETNNIKNSISQWYVKPSFCSTTDKKEIAVGESATYTDDNNVIKDFNINCSSDIECKLNGNKLTVTAKEAAGEQKITLTKNSSGNGTTLYKTENVQGVVLQGGKVEGVSCEVGLATYQNVQTSGSKIIVILSIGLLFGLTAYIMYYRIKKLDK